MAALKRDPAPSISRNVKPANAAPTCKGRLDGRAAAGGGHQAVEQLQGGQRGAEAPVVLEGAEEQQARALGVPGCNAMRHNAGHILYGRLVAAACGRRVGVG